jgi:hypothetical protein
VTGCAKLGGERGAGKGLWRRGGGRRFEIKIKFPRACGSICAQRGKLYLEAMTDRPKRPRDAKRLASLIVDFATEEPIKTAVAKLAQKGQPTSFDVQRSALKSTQ